MEGASVEPIEGAINQLVSKDQANLGLWTNILKTKCCFQGGIMLPRFNNGWKSKQVVKLNKWFNLLFNLPCECIARWLTYGVVFIFL
jgi:hypothetical protein